MFLLMIFIAECKRKVIMCWGFCKGIGNYTEPNIKIAFAKQKPN